MGIEGDSWVLATDHGRCFSSSSESLSSLTWGVGDLGEGQLASSSPVMRLRPPGRLFGESYNLTVSC